jgi:hypothetical protein
MLKYAALMNRYTQPSEYPELSAPADVDAGLSALEAQAAAMQGAYSEAEIYRTQVRGAMAIASAVHTQEVIGPRDRLWRDISTVIRCAAPFAVDFDHGTARARWAFVDTPVEDPARHVHPSGHAYGTLTAEALLRVNDPFQPEAKMVGEALKYVADPVTYSHFKIPEAPLSASVRKVGFNQYQFDTDQLALRAAEGVLEGTRLLRTSRYGRFDFRQDWSLQARTNYNVEHVEVRRQDTHSGGIDERADWLKMRYSVDPAYDNDVSYLMMQTLRECDISTVQGIYDYLTEHYIEPGKAALADAQQVANWLLRSEVRWVTPRGLGLA